MTMRRAANRTMLVWKLVVISVIINLVPIQGKRQQPRHDEIERVINSTHSVIWKCSASECQPGLGLNVPCGTSISISMPIKCVLCEKGYYSNTHDYSMCKTCKNCGKHEKKTGECTTEEDTVKCLGICHKGFYMNKITGDCQPCSDCCGDADRHHEKQCEDSGLPLHQQCRQTNAKCHHPTKADPNGEDRHQESQGGLQGLEVAAIVIGSTLLLVLVVFGFLIWYFGWQQVMSLFKRCCCCLCNLTKANGGRSVHFSANGECFDQDLESASSVYASGSPLTENAKEPENSCSGSSAMKAKLVKRVTYQRLLSVPVEPPSNSTLKIPRSHSHPGCLKDASKTWEKRDFRRSFKKLFNSPRIKKPIKQGYTPVATEAPVIDDLHFKSNGMCKDNKDGFLKPSTKSSVELLVQEPGKEGVEKPLTLDQCTSVTGLHVFGTTLKVSDVPQDFLTSLMSKSMSDIPFKFYRKICIKLDTLRELYWDDFRLLGENIGLSKDEIAWLAQKGHQTKTIIEKFDSKKNSSIGKFKAILEKMERDDVVTIIDEWVVDEWKKLNTSNNSPSTSSVKGYKLKSFV